MNTVTYGMNFQPVNSTSPNGDTLWTVDDVANFLKLHPETIRSMARRGELPAIKFGKVWRFQSVAIHAIFGDIS